MTNAFIFHGTEGHPQENWFPWLKGKLEEKSVETLVPQFPSPPVVAANVDEWFGVLEQFKDRITEDTIIIGHSLGGVFALRVLERLDHPVKAVFLVGTPIGVRPILNYDRDCSFSGFDFDWSNIASKAEAFVVFQSDDDPYVGLENGQQLAEHLGVPLSFIPRAGHFNEKAGFTSFDQIWERLESIVNS